MPLYEYVCRDCGTGFEKLVRRFGDEVACPGCAGGSVEKQLSVFAVSTSASGPTLESCGAGACSNPSAGCGAGPCGDATAGGRGRAGGRGACGLPS